MEAPAPLRKSLALVFCDIAGTNRLISQEGDLVAFAVFREFFEHASRLSREHHCLMIKFVGDSFLAAFENTDDVMPFIISVKNLLSQNSIFIGRISGFHLSVHYGHVVFIETSYGSEVLGEDVDIVAQLNDLARARSNEMVVSQAALERLPCDYRTRAGPSEFCELKRIGKNVEFHRLSLSGS